MIASVRVVTVSPLVMALPLCHASWHFYRRLIA
jgi:hypothetical protein